MDTGLESVVNEFGRLANQYFSLIGDRHTDRTVWLERVEIAVVDLYGAGLRLPLTEPSDQDEPKMPIEDRRRLMIGLTERLGGDSTFYLFVFHPFEPNASPVGGTLAEDLASIYEDLHDGAAFLAAGGSADDVIWTWRHSFQSHWGRHALGALQALNAMLR
jgi:uncharacterized protein DUF5063